MKLFVWEGVLTDYSSGMIVAIAPTLEKALAAIARDSVREEAACHTPEVVEITRRTPPQSWHVYGGG